MLFDGTDTIFFEVSEAGLSDDMVNIWRPAELLSAVSCICFFFGERVEAGSIAIFLPGCSSMLVNSIATSPAWFETVAGNFRSSQKTSIRPWMAALATSHGQNLVSLEGITRAGTECHRRCWVKSITAESRKHTIVAVFSVGQIIYASEHPDIMPVIIDHCICGQI